jgi:uncharacterized protein (TIGR03067 family)
MRKLMATAAVALLLGVTAHGQDPTKADQERLQGAWLVQSLEAGGKKIIAEPDGSRMFFVGDKMAMEKGGKKGDSETTFKIDATKKPKHLDLIFKDKDGNPSTIRGIYDLDGDNLKVCYRIQLTGGKKTDDKDKDKTPFVEARPSSFDSSQGVLVILKRAPK